MTLESTFVQWLKRMNIEDLYINPSFFIPESARDKGCFLSIVEACKEENIRVGLLVSGKVKKDEDLKFFGEVFKILDDHFIRLNLNCFLGVFACKPSEVEDFKQKAHFIKSQALSLRPDRKTLTFVYDEDVQKIADILALDQDSQTLIVENNAQIIQPEVAADSLEMFYSFCKRIDRQEKSSPSRLVVADRGSLLPPSTTAVASVVLAAPSRPFPKIDSV